MHASVSAFAAPTGEVILTNAPLRVEIAPADLAIRFVGHHGGANLLEPGIVATGVLAAASEGGLYPELFFPDTSTTLRPPTGATEVLLQTENRAVLLGPAWTDHQFRIKMEVELKTPNALQLSYTLLSGVTAPPTLILRTKTHLPTGLMLALAKTDGTLQVLNNTEGAVSVRYEMPTRWLAPIPPLKPTRQVLLGAHAARIAFESPTMHLLRMQDPFPYDAATLWNAANYLCTLDDPTRRYTLTCQTAARTPSPATPLVLRETWELHPNPSP